MQSHAEKPLFDRIAESAAGVYFAYVLHGLGHPDMLRPGASEADAQRPLPGDDLVSAPHWQTTFAETIRAPRDEVWPWLVQLGYGRAGWYTWYKHDNGGAPSADRIVPELQNLKVGDYLPDGPRAAQGFGQWWVRALDRPAAMVLSSRRDPFDGREVPAGEKAPYIDCSWVFVLEEIDPATTRVLVRVRARICNIDRGALVAKAARLFFGVGDTVMERSLLQGLKERAERSAEPRPAA
jgi:hypothetical protein